MDGINGITAGYALAVHVPLAMLNNPLTSCNFVDQSLIVVAILSVLVFCLFNFRPRGKAKCFAGDVGSIGIAFILLFLIGKVIIATGDLTFLIFLLVYGVDGCLTICHRIMLHENLGEAHRKHAYQLMANELRISHPLVSCLYACLQLLLSLGFIVMTWVMNENASTGSAQVHNDDIILANWIYPLCALVVLAMAYVAFMRKYYWMHEEYLASLK